MRRFNLRVPVYIPEIIYWLAVRPLLFYRRIKYGYSFRKIPLTQEKFTKIDEKDFDRFSKYKWHAHKTTLTYYAARNVRINGKTSLVFMHRHIMNCPDDKLIDHINHNGLDNRRDNLRLVSCEQNNWNRRKRRGQCTSPYKGVFYRYGKWSAAIKCKGKHIFIGWFENEETAARAYDEKAKELFGEFACLNFPEKNPEARIRK
jgi:hypothetical protein